MKIIESFLKPNQYVARAEEFNQIVLHHTAGGSAQSTINWWNSNHERVATHFVIDRDGTIYQTIPFDSWGFHLYIASKGNHIPVKFKNLNSRYDRQSIGIEICNYGYIKASNGNFYTIYNRMISEDKVCKLDKPYKGQLYWEAYTKEQIKSIEELLLFLLEKYPNIKPGIEKDYSKIFDINKNALEFQAGIYSHTSYRTDKSDIYPDPNLITTLNSLHLKL